VIALTGNTGVATDNELLFEIIINGSHVNPLDYVNQN
jgi:murein DD-endopeptidase MepM/ murein hydrolase activator NlpD